MSDEYYDGNNVLSDSNVCDATMFGRLYATLYGACLNGSGCLPNPETNYMSATDNYYQNGGDVPIGILALRYHKLREDAISQGLLALTNGQLFDVPNRPQSPYVQQELFAATPMVTSIKTSSANFSIPSNLLHYTLSETMQSLSIDFGDGSGFRNVSIGQSNILVNYSSNGAKRIIFKLTLSSGRILMNHAELIVDVPLPRPEFAAAPDINLGTISVGGQGARVRGFSNCRNGTIRKPLIWVEGFNPNTSTDGFDLNIGNNLVVNFTSGIVNSANLWSHLDAEGYDVLYVDFLDGAADLRQNAAVVQEVIRRVNQTKIGNEPIVIIGESMGGAISKFAIRKNAVAL